jgi:aminoglycoside 3-N-acetyltransferase I
MKDWAENTCNLDQLFPSQGNFAGRSNGSNNRMRGERFPNLRLTTGPQDPMTCTYKQLRAEDVPMLKQLLRVFAEAFEDMDAYQSAIPRDEYLRSLLTNQGFIVLVALADDSVAGGLAAYVLQKFEQERLEIYIYDLAVAKQHRRKGIATKLINDLRHIASSVVLTSSMYRPIGRMKRPSNYTNRPEPKKMSSTSISSRDGLLQKALPCTVMLLLPMR